MALAPKYCSYLLKPTNEIHDLSKRHTIEIFLDLVCPYSKKMFTTLSESNFQFIFRHQVQPWHPQSCLLHYAVMNVNRANSADLLKVIQILFENQESFFDANVQDLSAKQIYFKIAGLINQQGISFVNDNLIVGEGNGGNALVSDMKYHMRFTRQLGVHVSPTVFINGIEDPKISSSWSVEQWIQHLKEIK